MKKIASLAIIILLVFILIPGVAFASDGDLKKVTTQVDKTNERIDDMIDKAVEKAEKFEDKKNADKLIDKLIDNLINKTNKIAENMIEKAEKQGIEVYCELIEVEIGDQIILIDPLRIGGT